MDRTAPAREWRSTALAVALFAITLNFLQPIVHAALLRSGAPAALWTVFCNAEAADPAGHDGSGPVGTHDHDCCLGLAHASVALAPPATFVAVERVAFAAPAYLPVDRPTSVGIRDGPRRPRGPPLLA
jgi:hypothetical protein